MIYLFFYSFIIYLIFDYLVIYKVLDRNLFFLTSGSKIENASKSGSLKEKIVKLVLNIKSKDTIQKFILYILIYSFIYFLNLLIFSKVLNKNFIPITIFGKTMDVISIFQDNFKVITTIYYISFSIFLIKIVYIIVNFIYPKIQPKETKPNECQKGIIQLGEGGVDKIAICENGMYQNVLITGSIGSGKTIGAICNICDMLIKQNMGGVILDIKGNFVSIVENICEKYGRKEDIREISIGSKYTFELLPKDLSNVEIASMLKQIISLLSISNHSDSYWLDKVQNTLLNILILIDYYNNKNKDMLEIHKLVTDNEYIVARIKECKEMLLKGRDDDKTIFEMQNAILFLEKEFLNLDSRVQSILKSEITRITIPIITEYEMYNQFGKKNNSLTYVDFNDKKQIIVLSMDIAKNRNTAKIIATFLKINFQREILKNIKTPIPTFFIADEYQEFVNVEDATFLSLSREAKCMNIISTQSYSSIKNTLKDEMATNVIIQNLVNKIWFRNDDNYTVQEIIKQLGKVNVKKETTQISENATESKKYILKKGFKNRKSNISKSVSNVTSKENEYDENFFTRELKTFEALCFVSDIDNGIIVKKIKIERWNNYE